MERFKAGLKSAANAFPKNKSAAEEQKEELQKFIDKYPSLTKLEEKTGRTRLEIVGVTLAVLFVLLIAGVFIKPLGIFMTRLFGFAYPAYKSFKAIESNDKDDDTQWLTYWCVFGVFSLIEEIFIGPKLEGVLPFYFVWKIVFLLWCYLPHTQGAELLYTEVVGPRLRDIVDKITEASKKKRD